MRVLRKFFSQLLIVLLPLLAGCGLDYTKSSSIAPTPPVALVIPDQPMLYVQNDLLWLSDGNADNATQLADVAGAMSTPAWIDETHILYTVAVGNVFETWMEDLVTRKTTHLTDWRTAPSHVTVAPNHAAITVLVEHELYVVALATGARARIHEAAIAEAWSPSSQQIVFTTQDGRLLSQDIGLNFTLDTPVTLLEQMVAAPLFLEEHIVVFEGAWEDYYTVLTLDIITKIITPLTSLRFSSADVTATHLSLQPTGNQIVYTRSDDTTHELNVWMINREKDLSKLILTKAYQPLWSTDPNILYYFMDHNVWRSTTSGFDKIKILSSITALATPVSAAQL